MTITHINTELAPANNQLAAFVTFTSDKPVRYAWTVLKRTTSSTSVDFSYASEDFVAQTDQVIKIPVIGLYAHYLNQVQIIFYDQQGAEVYNNVLTINTRDQTYSDATIFHLNIEQTDPAKFTSVWGNNSWLMTTYCNGYDSNGDLRCYYVQPYRNQMLRTHNGYFYIGSDEDEHWYGRRFFKIDILGNEIFEFDLRDRDGNLYANTHDLAWDSAGDLYMIGNDNPDRSTNTLRQDGWILKFSDRTGEMIWATNYTKMFDGASILNNSPTNDAHLNSLSWLAAGAGFSESILVHSRSACVTFAISPDDGHMLWAMNIGGFNPQFPAGQDVTMIDTTAIVDRENGAHTVLPTTNSAFADYINPQAGKFVLSLFDNRSCMDSDGMPVTRPITDDSTTDPYLTKPARGLFYAVDLQSKTATQVGTTITLPATPVTQITDFMGAIFEHGEYYSIYTNHARSFFISDAYGKMIASIYDVICTLDGYPEFPGECYRARMFGGTELASLLTTASAVANS